MSSGKHYKSENEELKKKSVSKNSNNIKKKSNNMKKNSKNISNNKKVKKEKPKKSIAKKIILTLLIISAIGSASVGGYILYTRHRDAKNYDELRDFMNSTDDQIANELTTMTPESRVDKVKELAKGNSDIVGWLDIEGTDISYPLLQGKDNNYYMTHNYKKEYSTEGSIFLDKDYDWSIPSSNLLIFGHNNRGTNEMFVGLMKYKKKDYYDIIIL